MIDSPWKIACLFEKWVSATDATRYNSIESNPSATLLVAIGSLTYLT